MKLSYRLARGGLILAAASLAAAVIPAASSTAASGAVPQWHGVPDNSALSADPQVAAGTAAAGDTAVMFVEPSSTTLRNLKIGQTFRLVPLSRAIVGASGRFDLRLHASAALASQEGPGGTLNFDVVVYGPSQYKVTHFGIASPRSFSRAALSRWKTVPVAGGWPTSFLSASIPRSVGTKVRELGNKWDIVGETFSSDSHVAANFSYTWSTTSTLGVGMSTSSAYGGFSQNGTEETDGGGGIAWPTLNGAHNRYYDTNFEYGVYAVGVVHGGYFQTENEGWSAGSRHVNASRAPWDAQKCSPEDNGVTVTFPRGKALTWSNGVNMGTSLAGLQLSSQDGFTTTATTQYHWRKGRVSRACGVHGYPDHQGALIVTARG